MDENDNTNKTGEGREVPISQIIITFPYPGAADCAFDFVNVSPLQAVAAAWLLEQKAEIGFLQIQAAREEQERMNHITVPKPGIVDSRGNEVSRR